MKNCGIYEIVHVASGRRYIGHSIDIDYRWWQHRLDLDANRHHNAHLQNAWRKYGCGAFVFRIVETCPESMLLKREQAYIDFYWDIPDALYNIAREAHCPPSVKTEEQNAKNSAAHKGRPRSEETKKKISATLKGKTPSEAQLAGYERRRGKPLTDAQIAANTARRGSPRTPAQLAHDESRRGKPGPKKSPESIAKTRAASLGKPKSEETKRKLREANLGKPRSEETIAKWRATRAANKLLKALGLSRG